MHTLTTLALAAQVILANPVFGRALAAPSHSAGHNITSSRPAPTPDPEDPGPVTFIGPSTTIVLQGTNLPKRSVPSYHPERFFFKGSYWYCHFPGTNGQPTPGPEPGTPEPGGPEPGPGQPGEPGQPNPPDEPGFPEPPNPNDPGFPSPSQPGQPRPPQPSQPTDPNDPFPQEPFPEPSGGDPFPEPTGGDPFPEPSGEPFPEPSGEPFPEPGGEPFPEEPFPDFPEPPAPGPTSRPNQSGTPRPSAPGTTAPNPTRRPGSPRNYRRAADPAPTSSPDPEQAMAQVEFEKRNFFRREKFTVVGPAQARQVITCTKLFGRWNPRRPSRPNRPGRPGRPGRGTRPGRGGYPGHSRPFAPQPDN